MLHSGALQILITYWKIWLDLVSKISNYHSVIIIFGCFKGAKLWIYRKYIKNATKWSRQHARIQQRLSSTEDHLPPQVVFHWRSSSNKRRLPQKIFFRWRSSSTKCRLSQKDVFHQRLSSTKGCLLPKVVFHRRSPSTKGHLYQRSSSTQGCLPPKVVFHPRSSSTEGPLSPKFVFPLKVVFQWRLSSTKGRLPPPITPWLILYLWVVNIQNIKISASYLQCMLYDAWCNTLVDFIFVRTVNILNFSLLPCLEVAYNFFDIWNGWTDRRTKSFIEEACGLKSKDDRKCSAWVICQVMIFESPISIR